jgi:hypothetical protein
MMALPDLSLPATSESFFRCPHQDHKPFVTRITPANVIKSAKAFERVANEVGRSVGCCKRMTTAPPTSAEKSCANHIG